MPAISTVHEVTCDALVVGAGAAGCCAAAAALESGAKVCLTVKGYFAQIGMRGSGASACGNTEFGLPRLPDVSGVAFHPEQMVENAVKAGLGMAERSLIHTLAELAPETRADLERWGCIFLSVGAGGLGYPFVRALEKKIRSGAEVIEHIMIHDLIVEEGECRGAFGYDVRGARYVIHASAVVLAAGGDARLFSRNVHPSCCTADGYAMALRAGAELMNLEFMQIFTATAAPTRNLVHTWKPEQLELLENRHGRFFLEDYLPQGITARACLEENIRHAPFSTRDAASRYLAVGIVKEIIAGRGTDAGGVLLDLRPTAATLKPAVREFLNYKGIDVTRNRLEITMAHQCSNGGMRVGTDAMSSVPGLFGAGEAITGTHGADRIGANMLAQCAVFGRLAGRSAARFGSRSKAAGARSSSGESWKDRDRYPGTLPGPLSPGSGSCLPAEEVTRLRTELAEAAWEYGLVVRSAQGLGSWLERMNSVDERVLQIDGETAPEDVIARLELRNLLLVGKAVCRSELVREESRGPHYREEFPELDTARPPAATVVRYAGNEELTLRSVVVDPEWNDRDGLSFGSMRWG